MINPEEISTEYSRRSFKASQKFITDYGSVLDERINDPFGKDLFRISLQYNILRQYTGFTIKDLAEQEGNKLLERINTLTRILNTDAKLSVISLRSRKVINPQLIKNLTNTLTTAHLPEIMDNFRQKPEIDPIDKTIKKYDIFFTAETLQSLTTT